MSSAVACRAVSFMRRLGDISYYLNRFKSEISRLRSRMAEKQYRGRIARFLAVIPSGVEGSLDFAMLRSG